ncbi:acyltransferase family protein [Flavobacterium sp. 7A]|uniref:acyltransferase family protein n=1 Tax=Flavobacterium sp. 7A TaxID=2940571 RepID=UPI002226E2E1|nr:acyltransferase [Flavobacterium sp. 7A]MCW2118490.1 peptidoglycan/LPS O-acetylase OafA/YrhL [Flavobacterium sp. 7A]
MNNLLNTKPTFSESTWAILAITRFVLAFIVMYGHLYDQIFGHKLMPCKFIYDLGGKTAVVGFLLISGISIGFSYAQKKQEFIKRRFLRIYPLYFAAVLFTIFVQYYLGSPYSLPNSNMASAGILTSISNVLLLQGIASITITYNGPLWSIGVEAFLYLMVPLLMPLRLRYIVIMTILSMLAFTFLDYDVLYVYSNLIWAWPFLIGLIISAKNKPISTLPLLIFCLLIVNYQNIIFKDSLSVLTVFLVIVVCGIALYFKNYISDNLIFFLDYLGKLSYPIYVIHMPMYLLFYHIGIRQPYAYISLVILLCIPINYVFDVWLKNILWKPLTNSFDAKVKNFIKNFSISM